MAGIAITAADPIPTAGPAASKDTPGGAGLFGDALGAAVAGDQQTTDPSADATDAAPQDAKTAPQQSLLLGAAAALAAMLGRGAGAGAAAPQSASATTVGSQPHAPAQEATAPAAPAEAAPATDVDPSAALPAAPALVKGGGAAPHEDDTDDAAATIAPTPTPAAPSDPTAAAQQQAASTAVVPTPIQVAAQPTVATPARDGRLAAARVGQVPAAHAAGSRDRAAASDDLPATPDAATTTTTVSTTSAASTAPITAAPTTVLPAPDATTSASAAASVAPVQQVAPTTAPVAPQAVAPTLVATTDPTVAQQLQGPLMSLRSAPDGEHVMVVRVNPEHLGQVTVHATVSHGDLSVQLIASTSSGRDALQSMMGDLRRDLGTGGAGTATSLSLSTGDAPQQDQRGQGPTTWVGTGAGGSSSGGGSAARDDRSPWTPTARPADDTSTTDRRLPTPGSALLDVLA